MTLALAYASRVSPEDDPGKNQVYVACDTRLTIGAGHFDLYLKALSLGPRSAAVAAGHATVFQTAVEAARPFIDATNADRRSKEQPPLSVWTEASLVWRHLGLIYRQFREVISDASVCIVVAGFFSDNTPGLVRLEKAPESGQITVYRPGPGERVYTVAGVPEYVPIMQESLKRSAPPGGNGYHHALSVLWDIIKHQGQPATGIGGQLSFGFAQAGQNRFMWPIISIESEELLRGLRYQPGQGWPTPMKIDYDPSLFAALEREHSERPFSGGERAKSMLLFSGDLAIGDHRLALETDDLWLIAGE